MRLLPPRGCSLSHWATDSLVVLLLGVALLSPDPPEGPIDTHDWTLAQLLEHLEGRGVQLHLVPAPRDGGLTVYLAEDPDTTWASVQRRPVLVEQIHQWRGTVRVARAIPGIDEGELAMWGGHGCRIGAFILFGDERLLQCIQAACRQ